MHGPLIIYGRFIGDWLANGVFPCVLQQAVTHSHGGVRASGADACVRYADGEHVGKGCACLWGQGLSRQLLQARQAVCYEPVCAWGVRGQERGCCWTAH